MYNGMTDISSAWIYRLATSKLTRHALVRAKRAMRPTVGSNLQHFRDTRLQNIGIVGLNVGCARTPHRANFADPIEKFEGVRILRFLTTPRR